MKKHPPISLMQQYLPNLKIRNQFIIMAAILVFFIVLIIVLWNFAHYTILNSLFLNESDKLFEIQTQTRITKMLDLYKGYYYEIFALNGNALISFHRLYLKTKNQLATQDLKPNENYQMIYEGTIQIPDPLRVVNQYGSNTSYSFMCYSNTSAYSSPLTEEEKFGIKIQEQIQAYGQIIYQDVLIMQSNIYSYIDSQKINNLYPCVNRGKGIYTYAPQKRDWYKLFKKTYTESNPYNAYTFKFTPPYLLFTYKTVGLSMTLPIVDENLQFLGGVASTFLGSKLVQYLSNNQTGFQLIYLVSEDGTMIMHPFTVPAEQLPIYIYNETITGYNKTDWQEMLNESTTSRCDNFSTLKCRYNSLTQQTMIVSVQKLSQYEMYLIMQLSSDEYTLFTNSFHENLQTNLLNITILQIITLLILFVTISLLIFIATHFLFSPLEIIIQTTKHLLTAKKSKVLYIPSFTYFFMSHEVFMLLKSCQYSYLIMEFLSVHKNEQCQEIENIQYPISEFTYEPFSEYYYSTHKWDRSKRNALRNYVRDNKLISGLVCNINNQCFTQFNTICIIQ